MQIFRENPKLFDKRQVHTQKMSESNQLQQLIVRKLKFIKTQTSVMFMRTKSFILIVYIIQSKL